MPDSAPCSSRSARAAQPGTQITPGQTAYRRLFLLLTFGALLALGLPSCERPFFIFAAWLVVFLVWQILEAIHSSAAAKRLPSALEAEAARNS